MVVLYYCDNCNKRYTLEEYSKLEIVYITDDRSLDILVPRARKCSNCGSDTKL